MGVLFLQEVGEGDEGCALVAEALYSERHIIPIRSRAISHEIGESVQMYEMIAGRVTYVQEDDRSGMFAYGFDDLHTSDHWRQRHLCSF